MKALTEEELLLRNKDLKKCLEKRNRLITELQEKLEKAEEIITNETKVKDHWFDKAQQWQEEFKQAKEKVSRLENREKHLLTEIEYRDNMISKASGIIYVLNQFSKKQIEIPSTLQMDD